MKREIGYYWVKVYHYSRWEAIEWTGDFWKSNEYAMGYRDDDDIFLINEIRIKSPDEK